MLPSLSQLPIGAPGPAALEDDFLPMFRLRLADPVQPKANEVMNGRVLNARGDPQHVMDQAEEWRRKQLERMDRRRASGVDRVPGYRATHRTDPIPPVQWDEGVEVYADGALVNVLASTLDVPEKEVSVTDVRSAVRSVTGQSSAELARVVADISNTDGGTKLGWWAFGRRLLRAVPSLAVLSGVAWIVGALYNLYLLKEEAESEQYAYWADWNAFHTASASDARLDEVLIGRKLY